MKSFEGSFRHLNLSPSTSILLNFFFPFIDIRCFFSSLKLQYCRTIVLLNKLKLFKVTFFSKATMVMRFAARKNSGCPKAPRDFPPIKDGILYPRRVVLGLPSSSYRVCADGRTYGCTDGRTDVRTYRRTDVRTDGHVTLSSQPKFLGLIGYQISLAMELRWRALPAGSATIKKNRPPERVE